MSEQLLGVIIGGLIGFFGALLGTVLSIWAESRKISRENIDKVRLRIVGSAIQTSEVMKYVDSQRRGKWPYFSKEKRIDLSHAQLEEVDLREQDLRNSMLSFANLQKANLALVKLDGADLSRADLSEADLYRAKLRDAHLFRQIYLECVWIRQGLMGQD